MEENIQIFECWSDFPFDFTGACKILTEEEEKIRYYLDGELHRLDGPAIEFVNGDKSWYKEGKMHRLDGPAEEYANGYQFYWIDDKDYSEEEFNALPEVILHKAGLGAFI